MMDGADETRKYCIAYHPPQCPVCGTTKCPTTCTKGRIQHRTCENGHRFQTVKIVRLLPREEMDGTTDGHG